MRTKKFHRIIAIFLTLNFLCTIVPLNTLFANNNGPNAPEASGFEPVNATDMVNLSSGDMAYVLPLLEVDGFPVTLSYHAGIPMDMEASWVGLGWNINTGSIARGVVANPDDWGLGRKLNLTYLYGVTKSFTVNVGVGVANAAEVGVGLSWGSNKSLSGSVSASIGPVSASIDTDGNYGVGLSTSGWNKGIFNKISTPDNSEKSPFGGSLSISGNTKKGGIAVNVGGSASSEHISVGMGVSISSYGVGSSFSIGGGNGKKGRDALGAGTGISMNSFSAGDFSYNTKGFYIPLQIGIFSFGFGYSKTEIELAKAYNKYAYGILYHNSQSLYNTDLGEDVLLGSSSTGDYQRRNTYGDVYEQALPQTEEEFVGDYRNQIEKLNFTFGGYDSYDINATGIGGTIKPIVGQNTVLIGEGYDGASIRGSEKKTKVFYHNTGNNTGSLIPYKSITNPSNHSNKLNFSFDGQITEDAIVSGSSITDYLGTNIDIDNFISSSGILPSRPTSGSYVEVFTNQQINSQNDAYTNGVLIPTSLKPQPDVIAAPRLDSGYIAEGIGGYKITTPDGKVYHFMQPVYQYELVQHSFLNFEDAEDTSPFNSSSKREATPYATHWLLTAITGPDFIDTNNNSYPDNDDYGYWLRLDHGHWSNAYAWRSPYSDTNFDEGVTLSNFKKHYSTYIDNEVEKSDPGYFIQGRKDLYYLDKIVSKTQTAYFVKDVRHDGYGTSANYEFMPVDVDFNSLSYPYWQSSPVEFNDHIEIPQVYGGELAFYEREYQLKLDKIVIVNNKDHFQEIDSSVGNDLGGVFPNTKSLSDRYPIEESFFRKNLDLEHNLLPHMLHQVDNVLDVNDMVNFDYNQALKVIEFNYSYDLAKNTPSSGYTNGAICLSNVQNECYGRLTLENVKTYGRNMLDYMPPYVFDYKNRDALHEENYINNNREYIRANKDNWGFRENDVDAWSLNKIITPQGSTIEVDYEEDDFYVEAFSRKYWNKNLAFRIVKISNDEFELQIQNHANIDPNAFVNDFNDYFEIGSKVYIDFYLCMGDEDGGWIDNSDNKRGAIDIRVDDKVTVKSITNDSETGNQILKLKVLDIGSASMNSGSTQGVYGDTENGLPRNKWVDDVGDYPCNFPFLSNTYCPYGSDSFHAKRISSLNRGQCPNNGHLQDHGYAYNLKYKLLANKVPPGKSGGGLKVKDIVVKDNFGNEYITRYEYNDPFKGRTSGITSFNPIRGEVYVPYQNELPGPGVMYEWVTMQAIEKKEGQEKVIGSTRYHYYTLNPYFAIFNPNIEMKDIDGDPIFKAEVFDANMSFPDLTAKDMRIEKNLSKIGQLISIEEFNEVGHLINKTINYYQPRDGELSETFSSMKSVFDYEENDDHDEENFELIQHMLALSTKSEKVSVLEEVRTITPAGVGIVTYSEPDPYLGTYTKSSKKMADGSYSIEKKIPAYTKYHQMGSKLNNPNNKNMLTQEAMNVSSWSGSSPSSWNTTNATITTWDNKWSYKDNDGNTYTVPSQDKIWRKHKNFVWKGSVHPERGYYTNADDGSATVLNSSNDYFDWTVGEPVVENWQQVSEITRYNHWSAPIETKDINGNYLSSKMSDNNSKVVAGGNASLSEIYYSGAEYMILGTDFLEPEVFGAQYRSNEQAHTGNYSVRLEPENNFGVTLRANEHRASRYRMSVWVHKDNYHNAKFKHGLSGNLEDFNGEKVFACDWVQLNHYFDRLESETPSDEDLLVESSEDIIVTSFEGAIYVDDFRINPVWASVNSYVYDQDTDELTHILDANNMATKFVYDKAGRLYKTYKEVEANEATNGGFLLTNKYRYHYKEGPDVIQNWPVQEPCKCCSDENTDIPPDGTSGGNGDDTDPCDEVEPLTIKDGAIRQLDEGAYIRTFAITVPCDIIYYPPPKWSWLIDYENSIYSQPEDGIDVQKVPFAVKFCDTKLNTYDKVWSVIVETLDPNTGKTYTAKEEVWETGCKFELSPTKWADIEISTNYDPCSSETQYTFRPFVIKPEHNSYSYFYQTYNHVNDSWSIYYDVTNSNNEFCGEEFYAPSSKCDGQYSLYQTFRYRVVDNISGEVYQSNILDVYLDCIKVPTNEIKLPQSSYHDQYNVFGNVIEKNTSNEVVNHYNILK